MLVQPNFSLNGLNPPEVLNLIAGADAQNNNSFSLNPRSSLDNHVAMPDWPQTTVARRTVASILAERGIVGPTFIKIDTQGYETKVLRGLEPWLAEHGDWIIKMEFAPDAQPVIPIR
jgi:FkbM family methyltransferase